MRASAAIAMDGKNQSGLYEVFMLSEVSNPLQEVSNCRKDLRDQFKLDRFIGFFVGLCLVTASIYANHW